MKNHTETSKSGCLRKDPSKREVALLQAIHHPLRAFEVLWPGQSPRAPRNTTRDEGERGKKARYKEIGVNE
jgi:hypothetical protein